MIKRYCDFCGKDIDSSLETVFTSKEITFKDALWDSPISYLTCSECKDALFYLLDNPQILKVHIQNMKLGNRIRFLFKRKLKWSDSNENQ